MSAAVKLKRYALIIEKIQKSKYSTLQDIVTFLHKMDLDVSERTVQRDIESIRKECDVVIEYERWHRGYCIVSEASSENRIRFLRAQFMTSHFLEFIKDNPQQQDAILLDNEMTGKGIEYVEQILYAIRHCRLLEFRYQKFWDEAPSDFKILPYALKEFQGRWYLVGTMREGQNLFKFGLDRIQSLEVATVKFSRNKKIDVKAHFSKMIGINSEDGEREIIRLAFKPMQAKYIETLPMHTTQQVIRATENETVFEYFLIPNYEWMQKLLSYGSQVKVIQPKLLAEKHKKILREAIKQY